MTHIPKTTASGTSLVTPVLEPHELAALLRSPDRRTPTGARQIAKIHLMAQTGTRLGETLAIVPSDVAPEYWRVGAQLTRVMVLRLRAPTTKGGRPRAPLPLSPATAAAVAAWISWRAHLGIAPSAPLFCTVRNTAVSRPGRAVNPRQVRAELVRLAARARLGRHVHPHLLRHTALTSLYDRTRDLRLVQEVAGHASSATTERYTHVHPIAIAAAMGALSLPADAPPQLALALAL